MPAPLLSRRAALQLGGVGALALLSGCTGGDDSGGSPGAKGEPDPDLELLAQAIQEKQDLLDAYEATTSALPGLTSRLSPLQLDHDAHRGALLRLQDSKTGGAPPPSGNPSASTSPTSPAAPKNTDAALEALATAESAAASRRIGQCRSARDPELARLLASIGGCEAAHTAVLRTPVARTGLQQ